MYPFAFFRRRARLVPDAVAVRHPGGTLTYRTLLERVDALAAAIQSQNPTPGGRVGILAGNHLEHLLAWLAVLAAGKCWVPLNPRSPAEETGRLIEVTEPQLVIADADYRDRVPAGMPLMVARDGRGSELAAAIDRKLGKMPAGVSLPLDAPQAIKFTGGSTALPKGVVQPYRAWNTNLLSQLHAIGLQADDVYVVAAPITHGTGTYLLPTLAAGGSILLLERTRPADLLEAFATGGGTTTFLPPTLIYMLLQEPDAAARSYPSLRHLIYGGAPMRVEAIRKAQAAFGPRIAVTYGQTEAPQIMAYLDGAALAEEANIASVGPASLMTEVAVMAPDGTLMPAGEAGEVVARGDLLMTGYWRNPEETAKTIRNGWLHTGDVGVLDERGYLFIRDRMKEMIITGGFNVVPADVENALGRHPDVADCAVFGLPDEKWGEAVTAAVQRRAGSTLTEADLIAFAKERLGSVKAPKTIRFLDALPKTPVGKTDKPLLKRQAAGETG
ncbi:MAG: class I adenylate-forming enzyme family protein [Alphaproteobacteria bacterium]